MKKYKSNWRPLTPRQHPFKPGDSFPGVSNGTLVATTTGEAMQPVRLHYKIPGAAQVLAAFGKLKCLHDDPERQRWVWMFEDEAGKLALNNGKKPPRPISLGDFRFPKEGEATLTVRSVERAIEAIKFFDKKIPREVLHLETLTVINRLFSAGEISKTPDPNDWFVPEKTVVRDPEAHLREVEEAVKGATDQAAKLAALEAFFKRHNRIPDPEIENFPTHFYEDGIDSVALNLRPLQIAAMRRWQGDIGYTSGDALSEITNNL